MNVLFSMSNIPGKCVRCGALNDCATNLTLRGGDVFAPGVGDISICWTCGSLSAFTGCGYQVRHLSPHEERQVHELPEVQQAVAIRNHMLTALGRRP